MWARSWAYRMCNVVYCAVLETAFFHSQVQGDGYLLGKTKCFISQQDIAIAQTPSFMSFTLLLLQNNHVNIK